MGVLVAEGKKVRPGTPTGVVIDHVEPGSPAARAGIRAGDRLLRINGVSIRDTLDVYLELFEKTLEACLERDREIMTLCLRRHRGEDVGMGLRPERPTVCNSKCIFCFVDQMPPGLRRSLYIKDEDYRLSFLHGNYLTLTNLGPSDEERIRRMHLSPLYVSVHATDPEARTRLLGRRHSEPVLDIMDRLGHAGIRFHTQIVLVPGYNDGQVLEQSLGDLCERHEYVLSVSVVPVGLTAHRNGLARIDPVDRELATRTVRQVERIHFRMRDSLGRGLVYAGDEVMLLAGLAIPDTSYYDDYPQIDNGVGLIRYLLDSLEGLRVPGSLKGKRIVLVTGKLAEPYIRELADLLGGRGIEAEVIAVTNRLFGPSVTVSGLLSGEDISLALDRIENADLIVLPPNVLNPDGLTLDSMSLSDVEAATGIKTITAEYDFRQTVKRIKHVCETK
jgi:putative radical SAM enzyme (TIGR03279 family)